MPCIQVPCFVRLTVVECESVDVCRFENTFILGPEKLVFLISSNYTGWILPFRCYSPICDELFCRHVLVSLSGVSVLNIDLLHHRLTIYGCALVKLISRHVSHICQEPVTNRPMHRPITHLW